jgi:hypothetical protein
MFLYIYIGWFQHDEDFNNRIEFKKLLNLNLIVFSKVEWTFFYKEIQSIFDETNENFKNSKNIIIYLRQMCIPISPIQWKFLNPDQDSVKTKFSDSSPMGPSGNNHFRTAGITRNQQNHKTSYFLLENFTILSSSFKRKRSKLAAIQTGLLKVSRCG